MTYEPSRIITQQTKQNLLNSNDREEKLINISGISKHFCCPSMTYGSNIRVRFSVYTIVISNNLPFPGAVVACSSPPGEGFLVSFVLLFAVSRQYLLSADEGEIRNT